MSKKIFCVWLTVIYVFNIFFSPVYAIPTNDDSLLSTEGRNRLVKLIHKTTYDLWCGMKSAPHKFSGENNSVSKERSQHNAGILTLIFTARLCDWLRIRNKNAKDDCKKHKDKHASFFYNPLYEETLGGVVGNNFTLLFTIFFVLGDVRENMPYANFLKKTLGAQSNNGGCAS